MTDILSENSSVNSRLGNCEVCNYRVAKYTCPECEVKTCCLPCVKIHKKELNCSGIRNKVKFKPLKAFSNMDFQSDYMLLESTTRAVDTLKKNGNIIRNSTFYNHPKMKMRTAAHKRNIHLYYLPKNFTRHKTNTTFYNWRKDKIFWKVEWVFPDADMISLVDARVPESEPLIDSLKKYIDPDLCEMNLKKVLSDFHKDLNKNIAVLLKGEQGSSKKFYLVDKNETIMENLSNKKIIEYPTFYVIRADELPKYGITNTEPSRENKFSSNFKGMNLLFDSDNTEEIKEDN